MNIKNVLKWVFIIIIIGLFLNIGKSIRGMFEVNERIEKASQVVNQLNDQKQKLIKNNTERSSDNYFEKQIRDKLKLVKENEVLVVLPGELDDKEVDDGFKYISIQKEKENKRIVWEKWFGIFF